MPTDPQDPPDKTDAKDAGAPAWLLATLFTLISALLLIPGLSDYGLGSTTELPIFDHARALMGETVAEVERMPWLPSWARAWSIALVDSMAALRLPGAIAVSGTIGLTVWIARARGANTQTALLAGAFALSFPGLIQQARSAVGNPVGEFFSTLAVAAGVFAVCQQGVTRRLLGVTACAAALLLATLSAGVVLGALIPVIALALLVGGHDIRYRQPVTIALWIGAAVIAALAGYLAFHQGEGYIPILGASRHTEIIARPSSRLFHQIVEDFGYQVFPWLPVAVLGVLGARRDRWPALWLLAGFAVTGIWTLSYGRVPLPIAAPAGLCCGALIGEFASRKSSRGLRRFVLLAGLAGLLIMAKDADRTPSRVGMPITERRGEHNYPAAEIGAKDQLPRQAKLAGLALLAVFVVAPTPRSPSSPSSKPAPAWRRRLDSLKQLAQRVPTPVREWAPAAIMLVTLGLQAVGFVRLLDRTLLHESPMRPLQVHAELAASGALPETLALGQVRDKGVELYGPAEELRPFLKGRNELTRWLSREEPIAALIRATDLPFVTQQHRMHGWPLYVIDHSNRNLALVSNRLPPGFEDQNKLYEVLRDEPPALPGSHETLVQFEGLVDVIAWRISEPVVRGREFELELVLAAHGKLPGTAEIYARLLQGRVSRINPLPQKIAGDRYPPKYWREGDFILHHVTVKAPTLEVMPGEHKLVVGLRRSKTKNFSITIPAGKTGDHGVEVIDKRRNFASLGTVTVY